MHFLPYLPSLMAKTNFHNSENGSSQTFKRQVYFLNPQVLPSIPMVDLCLIKNVKPRYHATGELRLVRVQKL